ncbi:MAG: putative lipid II flippase FtsW [Clostridia bacterium]|nr:putative lipid II flippase FtsW [Clostridia bacterium]
MAKVKKRNKIKLISNEPVDFTLLITVFILLGLGIITVLSASSPTALAETGDSYRYLYKQGISAIIGIVIMFFASKFDYHILQKQYKLIYGICIALLLSVSFIGVSSGGAKRWINLGFTTFQPSELAKVGVIIFYSAWLTKNKERLKEFKIGFIYPFAMLIPVIVIVLGLQTHFSATLVMVMLVSILMVMAGTKILHFVFVGVPTAIAGIVGIFTLGEGFRLQRLITFLDPWQDITGSGWQIIQSLYAIGSGGLFGVGLGDSKQKYLYIPEPHNDFIFSVLAEELGFVGCAFVIILFAIFVWRGIVISMKAPDMFGSLVAVGITSMIGIQVLINIAVVTSSMPVTGMALPFFSYGGTALIIILASVGILLNISRSRKKI